MRPVYDLDHAARRADAIRLAAVTPTIVAALHRLGQGLEPVAPRTDLGHAAGYLWMLFGEEPTAEHARAIEQYLMLTVDHGFNASTFTSRVIASTGADMGAARRRGHRCPVGSAPRRRTQPGARPPRGDRLTGAHTALHPRRGRARGADHGLRPCRLQDRGPALEPAEGIALRLGGERAAFAADVEREIVDALAELKPGRQLYANVEFYAGVVMERCGIPAELFTPTFAVSRVIGWSANVLEQAADNRIIRPSARYVGPPPPEPLPPL